MDKDFDELMREVRACRICETHLPLGPRPFLQMHPESKILVVGQAPGTRAHETATPFNDASGDRLREWMGVDRETFYDARKIALLPMGFCYPGNSKSADLPPRRECAPAWREPLLKHLPNIRLTLIIGRYAALWHLGKIAASNITETVKAWRDLPDAILVLPHPSPRNNIWLSRNKWFEAELLPALKKKVKSCL